MMQEIPQYCLRAYALFYTRHGSREPFGQSELEWIVSPSMRKKIFAVLLKSGWIQKHTRKDYTCINPDKVMRGLLEFRVPESIKESTRPYAFTNLSAIEIWSDYSYVQRGIERSPYFIKVLRKDLGYWKDFFNRRNIPNYTGKGSTIGEYVILIPSGRVVFVKKNELNVEPLNQSLRLARQNEMYSYAYNYMRHKYGPAAG